MSNYEKMRIAIRYWLHGKNYFMASRAMEFASAYHTGLRKDGETPEFHHQVCIASYIRTLPSLLFPEETLASTFLHDVVEDYDVDLSTIENRFGKNVRRAVALLSKKIEGYKADSKEYYKAMRMDPIASIIKGADRMHNFQTMPGIFTPAKQRVYIGECENKLLPMIKIAKREFPEQEPAYENIKHVLISQMELLKLNLIA